MRFAYCGGTGLSETYSHPHTHTHTIGVPYTSPIRVRDTRHLQERRTSGV